MTPPVVDKDKKDEVAEDGNPAVRAAADDVLDGVHFDHDKELFDKMDTATEGIKQAQKDYEDALRVIEASRAISAEAAAKALKEYEDEWEDKRFKAIKAMEAIDPGLEERRANAIKAIDEINKELEELKKM
ncbi:MAG: hypothetical protein NTY12_01335 [Candidatus Falkowbacteria bacterium]|nr:hypothetical protein [Candidatus Falkowbacteria bacterium]